MKIIDHCALHSLHLCLLRLSLIQTEAIDVDNLIYMKCCKLDDIMTAHHSILHTWSFIVLSLLSKNTDINILQYLLQQPITQQTSNVLIRNLFTQSTPGNLPQQFSIITFIPVSPHSSYAVLASNKPGLFTFGHHRFDVHYSLKVAGLSTFWIRKIFIQKNIHSTLYPRNHNRESRPRGRFTQTGVNFPGMSMRASISSLLPVVAALEGIGWYTVCMGGLI